MLHDWTNLFNITGAAGAQLIGLLFVVVTLGSGWSAKQSEQAIRAFVTPTLVSFSGVLFEALVVLAPWPSVRPAAVLLVLGGLGGVSYRINAVRLRGQAGIAELHGLSWIAYNGVPLLANVVLLCGGGGLYFERAFAPFAIAGASTLQLAAGIFGAWDVTLWILTNRKT
jgi:hypothetical protein